jgi:hypothetical protein
LSVVSRLAAEERRSQAEFCKLGVSCAIPSALSAREVDPVNAYTPRASEPSGRSGQPLGALPRAPWSAHRDQRERQCRDENHHESSPPPARMARASEPSGRPTYSSVSPGVPSDESPSNASQRGCHLEVSSRGERRNPGLTRPVMFGEAPPPARASHAGAAAVRFRKLSQADRFRQKGMSS